MKKITILMLALLALAWSCDKKEEEESPEPPKEETVDPLADWQEKRLYRYLWDNDDSYIKTCDVKVALGIDTIIVDETSMLIGFSLRRTIEAVDMSNLASLREPYYIGLSTGTWDGSLGFNAIDDTGHGYKNGYPHSDGDLTVRFDGKQVGNYGWGVQSDIMTEKKGTIVVDNLTPNASSLSVRLSISCNKAGQSFEYNYLEFHNIPIVRNNK